MLDFAEIKEKSKIYIEDRHLYVSNIIKTLYDPNNYKSLCEVGSGNLELAKLLAKHYKRIDAYETLQETGKNLGISNLRTYGSFNWFVDISQYDLLISVCPYCYSDNIYDDIDPEEDTNNLLQDIVDKCLVNDTDLFLILANTPGANKFLSKLYNQEKYRQLISDAIDLHYIKMGETKVSNNKLLIYKR